MRRLVLYNLLLIIVIIGVSCGQNYYVSKISYSNSPVEASLSEDDVKLVSLYQPYKQKLDSDMSRIIGISTETMEKNKPESSLTNFLADLLLQEGNAYLNEKGLQADISFFNYGGIRTFIPEGEIKVRNIYELMPFENQMVFLKLKGSDVKLFLDKIAEGGGDSIGGVRFKIAGGHANNIIINGSQININAEYWLVTNDYVASGGDDMVMLKNATENISSGKLIRDVLISHIDNLYKSGVEITAKLDGRISYE